MTIGGGFWEGEAPSEPVLAASSDGASPFRANPPPFPRCAVNIPTASVED